MGKQPASRPKGQGKPTVSSPEPDPMKQIADEIARNLGSIIDGYIPRASDIAGFDNVPMDVFRPMHERLFRWTLKALAEDDDLSLFKSQMHVMDEAASVREEFGIPIDSRLLGLQIVAKEMLNAARDAAESLGIGPDELVRFAQRIATWQTLTTELAVRRNRDAELAKVLL